MIDVTQWEKYSVALTNFLADRKDVWPVVLILTHDQCKLIDTYCITIGKITKFNPDQFGWYYKSCTKYSKESKSNGSSYRCTCKQDVDAPLTRYKVVVHGFHDSHKAEFVFWDSEGLQIIGITAQALRKTKQENVIYDNPTQTFILEKNNASAKCSDSLNIPTI
uniref:Nucleic acid-binding, OB-fold n=1 Tax=Medicago truncatula TaxID=3880 RepID=A2Q243_MEDTR|nr:Nucleic acid-binding, OB-fold [Medicago truncatula]